GAVLYFMLCGKPPFDSPNPGALVLAQLHQAPPLPSERLGSPLPEDLEALIMRSLRKDPDERYATATEFVRALARCAPAEEWPPRMAVGTMHSSGPPSPGDHVMPRARLPASEQRAIAQPMKTPLPTRPDRAKSGS